MRDCNGYSLNVRITSKNKTQSKFSHLSMLHFVIYYLFIQYETTIVLINKENDEESKSR